MTYEEARKYLWREPFQPVRIRLKDGRSFDIPDRGWTISAEALLMVGVPPDDDPGSRFPDHLEWVQWPEVEAIESLPEPDAPTTALRGGLDSESGKPDNSVVRNLGGRIVMTCEEARKYLWRKPFQPVRIRLKDGRSFNIPNSRWAMAAEAVLIIGTPPADEPTSRRPDRGIWVQWPEVDSIEPLSEPAAKAV